jgi:hypothetical protein
MTQTLIDQCQQALDAAGLPWKCDYAEDVQVVSVSSGQGTSGSTETITRPATYRAWKRVEQTIKEKSHGSIDELVADITAWETQQTS